MAGRPLQVIAGGGIAGPLDEIAPRFERDSGHALVIRYGTTPELIKIATGTAFDVALVPTEVFRDADARARFVATPAIDIARVGLGIAVRAGDPRPDVRTPEALKQALLAARSVASIPASAAGVQILRAFDRLGIAEAMHAKMKAHPSPRQLVRALADGDAEIGMFLANVLMMAPGLDFVGPFPPGLQQEVVFTTSLAASTRETDAARAFVTYLRGPAAAAVIRAKGMNPA
jgi:molybdate transport system substrate-binding protein